ncbi:MAG: restriction endonuclease subunit S [Acidimicrobiales bacterium]
MKTVSLRRIFQIVNGGTPTSDSANWDGSVRWATPVDLAGTNGDLLSETSRTLTAVGARSASRVVPSDSLIISTRAPIGYVAQTTRPMALNQGCRGLVANTKLDARFYRYVLSTMTRELNSLGQGSTFIELTTDSLASLQVPAPALPDQERIADFLDAETARIDALIAKKQRMVELFDELRREVVVAGVAGEFTSTDFGPSRVLWLDKHPSCWRSAKLTLVAKLGSGHTPSRSHPEWWIDCTIPWITTGEVAEMRDDRQEHVLETREKISQLGIENSSATLRPAGTVVLCRTASAGYSAIMATDMATSQDFATWTCGPLLRPRFLLLCLRAMRQDLLGRLAMGSTHQTIYMPDIESLRIPLPDVQEQERIVESVWKRILKLGRSEDLLQQQINLLRERRQALITAAVTGQLDIPEVVHGNH